MSALTTFFPLHFSPSKLETVHKCQMAFFREYIQHLQGYSKNPDLIAGGLVAKACEIVRTSYFTEGLSETEAIELGKEHIMEGEDTGDSVKSNENVAYCLEKYFKKFRLGEALPPCSLVDGTHAVEYAFEFDLGIAHPDLPDRNILFIGRLDYLCEKVELNRTLRYGLDEKSCKSIFRLPNSKVIDYKKEADQYRTNGQILAYCFAARELGINLESFLIRRIPIMSTFEEAFELEIPITQYAIDQWYTSTIYKIRELVENYRLYKELVSIDNGKHPYKAFPVATQNLACMSYSRACKYQEGCLSADGEALLTERFPQRVWDSKTESSIELTEYIKGIQ